MSYLFYKKMAIVFVILLVTPTFLTGFAVAVASKTTLPSMHMIMNVPWHQQFNALSCGDAALEIVFDYWGPDIDQKEITNVARSSSSGTYTPDIVRAGQFSNLSNAQGSFFPAIGPIDGYKERALGYGAFSYTSSEFWLNELKTLIANDIPVIVLMKYYPWGRDLNHLTNWTGVISWSYADFQMGWNYSEYGSPNPYFGAVIMPWSIDISVKGRTTSGSVITVTAYIKYPCPKPFDNTQYPAQNAIAQISLPDGMIPMDSSTTVSLDTIYAGSSTKVTWKVLCNTDATGKTISVSAWGIVSGGVPEARWQGQTVYYPAYSYTDAVGGEMTMKL